MKAETREHIGSLFGDYPEKRGALLPAIYALQAEKGYVDVSGARELAEIFDLQPVEVWEVLSFYNMFYTSPQARHHVYVCTNLSCSLRGGRRLLKELESHLGIRCGQMTLDGRIALGHEECLGSCGTAPVLRVDGVYHEDVDSGIAREIVDGLE